MAKIKIQGNASGTGVITLEAPNTNTDRTITLPDGDISLGVGIDDNATSTAITISASEKVTFDNDIDTRYTRVNNGGAGTAAFGFNGDTDTGLFLPSANTLAVTTGGSEAARFLSSGGITFNGDTAAANALDDYEEGTWTPTLSSSGISVAYSSNNGKYTKVGNIVTVTFQMRVSSHSGGSAGYKLAGLPFSSSNANGDHTAVSTLGYENHPIGSTQQLIAVIDNGDTSVRFLHSQSSGGWSNYTPGSSCGTYGSFTYHTT